MFERRPFQISKESSTVQFYTESWPYTFFFYKNKLYKNNEPKIDKKVRRN